jgi:surface antigen
MRELARGSKVWLLGSALLCSSPLMLAPAAADQPDRHAGTAQQRDIFIHPHPISIRANFGPGAKVSQTTYLTGHAAKRGASRSYGVSCVPYARQVSGIMVTGNAWQWWNNASGLYARGDQPEVGSVLNFRPNRRMHLGHVAVVSRVVNAREVIVDHANWPSGGRAGTVSHDVAVVDVSEANNWSAVRVELGRDGTFGSVYPTYGFIYNRPDTGTIIASVTRPAPQPDINPIPSDLRPAAERPWRIEEVAEARSIPAKGIDLRVGSAVTRPGGQ